MKLNKFIINSIGMIILMIFILYIFLLFNRFTFIKNDEISQIPDTDIVKQMNDENNESIDPYKITKPYDYFVSSQRNFTLYEPMLSMPMLASGNNKANVTTIDSMRDFLEQMYAVTSKDETKDTSYNFCNKFAEIASTLPSVISDLRKLNREEIFKLYSAIAIPTQPPTTAKIAPPSQPPPIPIIKNNNDYVQLLTLCVRSTFLPAYVLPSVNINNKLDRKMINGYGQIDATDLGVVDSANALFIPIRDILNYFHNQYTSPPETTPGDIVDTASLSLQDSCATNALSYKIKEYRHPGTFSDIIPEWANAIQILIIGAGGGGGGGAWGCDTAASGQWSGGGGGGAGGNTGAVLYTTQKYSVTPKTPYTVTIGDGGLGGKSSGCCRNANETERGARGGDTTFSINNSFLKVLGASGGDSGTPGYCGRDNSQRQSDVKSLPNLPLIEGGISGIKTIVKNSIPGSNGAGASVNPGRVWNCERGRGGKGDFISKLPELEGPMFPKLQKKYGYSGNGGSGQTWDTLAIDPDANKLDLGRSIPGRPFPGTDGGSGYVCVFLFAS